MLSGAGVQAAFPEEETHMANPFTYLELHTKNPSKAKSFYTELFGWKSKDNDVPGFGTYTEMDIGEGPGAGLMAQQDPSAGSSWLAYIQVPQLDGTVARAQKLGASVAVPRTEIKDVGWFAILVDPSGARVGVFEKLPAR
jgi:uncharacterized protein